MGTNFHWKTNEEGQLPAGMGAAPDDTDNPAIHIGKRSAAGLYCWDCGCPCVNEIEVPVGRFTMRKRWANEVVHSGRRGHLDHCPICHKERATETKINSPGNPAGMELGFSEPYPDRPTGVRGASSFSWAQEPARVIQLCMRWPDEVMVVDEYDRELTGSEFLETVLICPLWFTESIGDHFS